MKNIFLPIALLISIFLTAQERYSIADIPAELSKNSNSVILNEKEEVDVSINGVLNYKVTRVVAVLNELGDNNVNAYVNYDNDTKVKEIEAYVYNIFGNEIEHYKKRDFKDVSAVSGFSIFEDDRVLYLDYIPTSYPYIIKTISEIENNSTAFLPSWYPVGGYARSTKKSEFILTFDPSNKPRFLAENINDLNIEISESNNQISCIAKDIKAFKYESLSLPFSRIAPNISFALNDFSLNGVRGSASNWNEFGQWVNNSLLNDVGELPETTKNEIKNLVLNAKTDEEKARLIYNYLQEKVRYISVQIGIGGWKPMLAKEVDKLGYGDCKALTNYTKSLLDLVGVESYYTVLYAGEIEKDFNEEFTKLQGNHAILAIPTDNDLIWLECTSQKTPFGYIGNSCDDRNVLIVTPNGGEIVKTKKYNFDENLQESNINIDIKNNKSAVVDYVSTYKGLQYDSKLQLINKSNKELEKIYKKKWDNLNGYQIEEIQIDNNKDSIIFKEHLKIIIPKIGSSIGNDFLIALNLFNKNSDIPPRINERERKLYIAQEFKDVDRVIINIPQNYLIENLPEAKIIENEFGKYSISIKQQSNKTIEYQREFILYKGVYPKEKYNDYRSFRKKIAKLDKTKIVIKTKS